MAPLKVGVTTALFRSGRGGSLWWRLRGRLADQKREARERKAAGEVINDVDLAEVQTLLQSLQRNIHLEDDRFAVRCGNFVGHDKLRLKNFCGPLEKFDAGHDAHAFARGGCWLGSFVRVAL